MSSIQQIQSKGVFHGLPVYPSNISGLTAIITGANGISGNYMLRVLSEDPKRWKRIICLSRRPPLVQGGLPSNAEHIPLDFLKDPQEIAKVLKEHNAEADYVFFFSYVQPAPKEGKGIWSNAEELVEVNSKLLENFLQALKLADVTPKRFMLQTGAKNYGVHLGPTKVPQEESDPRVELEPNFYYPQEDMLWKYCAENNVGWNIHMPGPIIGAVPDAAMNGAFPLAVYAAVCKKLGQPLEFPGDIKAWQLPQCFSSAHLNAYQEEWAVLQGQANQKYNTYDNSAFTWEGGWPRIAGWYGIEWKGPQDGDKYEETETRFVPRGYGPKDVLKRKFSMVEWAKKEEVQKAWREIAVENGIEPELRDIDRIFTFLEAALCWSSLTLYSMDKTRKHGWHGCVDSSEALLEVFKDLAKLKMIPPVPLVHVSFNG